jgi:hypothetical protein
VPVLCGAMLAMAAAISLAVLSTSTLPVVAMLYLTTTARSVLWTICYPLAATAAEQDGIGVGTSVGMLNGVWAATTVAGPLAAAVIAGHLGPRGAFGLTELVTLALVTATWLLGPGRPVAGTAGAPDTDRAARLTPTA